MNKNVSTLYYYELKKIIKSKLVMMLFLLMMAILILFSINPGDGENSSQRMEKKVLNGRKIDDALLNEMYLFIDDYGIDWNEENIKFKEIAEFEKNIVGVSDKLSDYSADELYVLRNDIAKNEFSRGGITEGEYQWWSDKKNKIVTPITYYYAGGEILLSKGFNILCVLMLFGCSIILSIVFVRENRYKTDQLIYTCYNGKKIIYIVKVLAGLTFSVCVYMILLATMYFSILFARGFGGKSGYIQLAWPWSTYRFTFGEYIFTQSIIGLLAVILISVFVMILSIHVKSSVTVIAVTMGTFFASQIINVSDKYRVISQLIAILPTSISNYISLYDIRLINLGYEYFTKYSVTPGIYLLFSICFLICGYFHYSKSQKK